MALNLNQSTGQTFGPSGSNHATGLVPDPGSVAGSTRFLREDATFVALPTFPLSVANGGTGDSSLTAYAVLCGGTVATAPFQSIGSLGAVGNVLTSNGAGALPSMQPPAASGAMTLLNTLTASSSATLSDTSSLTATYSSYLIVFINIVSSSTSCSGVFQIHSNSAFQATSYVSGALEFTGGTTANLTSTTSIVTTDTNINLSTSGGISGEIRIFNPSQTSTPKSVTCFLFANTSGAVRAVMSAGQWTGGNTAVDGFQFSFNTGNIASGTIKIYGIT